VSSTESQQLAVLYDGQCLFCRTQLARLLRLAGPDRIRPVDFQLPGALDAFPQLTWAQCMQQMWVVEPGGRTWGGMEAACRAFMTRPGFGLIAWGYYLPGIRQVLDAIYRKIAANRYAIAGKAVADGECESGSCQLHFPPPGDE
jgi:predicted DCC family thiol-disulfide oxidoreductase YuxK